MSPAEVETSQIRNVNGSVLTILRENMRAAHERIESIPCFSRLMRPTLTSADYVLALIALYEFHSTYALAAASMINTLPGAGDLAPSQAIEALKCDLHWFGVAIPPVRKPFLAPACPQQAVGMLYVLEGSTLGGRIIGKHVSSVLGVTPGLGGSFFCSSSATEVRARWQTFCSILSLAANDADGIGRICEGAAIAVASLEDRLTSERRPAEQSFMNCERSRLRLVLDNA